MEKDEILISWLSEFDYCPRRFWLKAIEKQEGDNQYTAEGSMAHQHVHGERVEKRREQIKVTGLHVRSEKYNLYGICDCVEFQVDPDGAKIPFLGETCQAYDNQESRLNLARNIVLYKKTVPKKLLPYLQAQLLSQFIRGDIAEYPPWTWNP